MGRRNQEIESVLAFLLFVSRHWLLILVCSLLFMWIYTWRKDFHWGAILVSNGFSIWANILVHISFHQTFGRVLAGQTWLTSGIGFENTRFFIVFGCDSITLWFSSLVFFVNFIALLSASVYFSKEQKTPNMQFHLIYLSALIALPMFAMTNLCFFYIFFEATILPVFFLIRKYGARPGRREHAANLYLIFSLSGSVFLISGLLLLFNMCGSFELNVITQFNHNSQIVSHSAAILIFLGFIIKVPLFPFHIWLPEAHVEAPTPGSILLAGYLLKLGAFGIFKFVVPTFSNVIEVYRSYIFLICCAGILYISVIALRQFDLKKIIAYSSIIHMAVTIIGLCALKPGATMGALTFMVSHGVIASMMFACVGVLYVRYHSKNLKDYGGLAQVMPVFAILFFISCISNFSFPGSSNFVGESIITISITQEEVFTSFIIVFSSIFLGIYSMWMFGRLIFGNMQREGRLNLVIDLVKPEYYMLGACVVGLVFLGFCPSFFLNSIEDTVLSQYVLILREGLPLSVKGGKLGFSFFFYFYHKIYIFWTVFFGIGYSIIEIINMLGLYDEVFVNNILGYWYELKLNRLHNRVSAELIRDLEAFTKLWEADKVGAWLHLVPLWGGMLGRRNRGGLSQIRMLSNRRSGVTAKTSCDLKASSNPERYLRRRNRWPLRKKIIRSSIAADSKPRS